MHLWRAFVIGSRNNKTVQPRTSLWGSCVNCRLAMSFAALRNRMLHPFKSPILQPIDLCGTGSLGRKIQSLVTPLGRSHFSLSCAMNWALSSCRGGGHQWNVDLRERLGAGASRQAMVCVQFAALSRSLDRAWDVCCTSRTVVGVAKDFGHLGRRWRPLCVVAFRMGFP